MNEINIISVTDVLENSFITTLDLLYKYNLVDNYIIDFSTRDVKNIVKCCFICSLMELTYDSVNIGNRPIVAYSDAIEANRFNCKDVEINITELYGFTIRLVQNIKNMLPIYFYKVDNNEILDIIRTNKGSGEYKEMINLLENYNNKIRNFSRIKKYAIKNNLYTLANQYFDRDKIKYIFRSW